MSVVGTDPTINAPGIAEDWPLTNGEIVDCCTGKRELLGAECTILAEGYYHENYAKAARSLRLAAAASSFGRTQQLMHF